MTERYIVLTEFPLLLSRPSLLLSGKPFIENYDWKPDLGTRFLVISKQDGTVVHSCKSSSFFAFHHVNAFEQSREIVVDLVAYPDSSVIQSLYLEPLLHHPEQVIAAGELRRYHIPLDGSSASYQVLTPEALELPRINYQRCNAHSYQFVYGVGNSQPGNFIDRVVKVNIHDRTTQIWQSPNCYPGEPVFVTAPDASSEDEGVILSVVLNVQTKNSFLLVLDAQSFEQLATVRLHYHLSFDFHGQYFDTIAPTERMQLHR